VVSESHEATGLAPSVAATAAPSVYFPPGKKPFISSEIARSRTLGPEPVRTVSRQFARK
jgi:hypothetical protein